MPEDELLAAKNRFLTSTFRQLDGNFFLMLRYGVADARGGWQLADVLSGEVQQVSSADLQRVVKKYFARENRAVATYTRKAGSEPEDPALAGLPAESQADGQAGARAHRGVHRSGAAAADDGAHGRDERAGPREHETRRSTT